MSPRDAPLASFKVGPEDASVHLVHDHPSEGIRHVLLGGVGNASLPQHLKHGTQLSEVYHSRPIGVVCIED